MTYYKSPKEPDPLPDLPNALGDRPAEGWWVPSLREPSMVWWRCPLCKGQIPFEPSVDIDPKGIVSDPTHTVGNEEGKPLCSWKTPVQLMGYKVP